MCEEAKQSNIHDHRPSSRGFPLHPRTIERNKRDIALCLHIERGTSTTTMRYLVLNEVTTSMLLLGNEIERE